MKKLMIALIMSVFLITLATAEDINITDCLQSVNTPYATYYLQNNITHGDFPAPCLDFQQPNVIFDGNGYYINSETYESLKSSIGIRHNNITIRNLNFWGIDYAYLPSNNFLINDNADGVYDIKIENIKSYNFRNAVEVTGYPETEHDNIYIKNYTFYVDSVKAYEPNEFEGIITARGGGGITKNLKVEDFYVKLNINSDIRFLHLSPINYYDNLGSTPVNNFTLKNFNVEQVGLGNINIDYLSFNSNSLYEVNATDSIKIEDNNAYIDSNAFPFLNVSSRVTLENLSFDTSVNILRDGVDCPEDICTLISYENGIAIFDVTGWSNYSLEQGEVPVIPEVETNDVTSTTTYQYMASGGAGLGKFMLYIAQSLPLLIIGLVFIGIVFVIGIAIAKLVRRVL